MVGRPLAEEADHGSSLMRTNTYLNICSLSSCIWKMEMVTEPSRVVRAFQVPGQTPRSE